MATDTELDQVYAEQALPTPSETPYRASSRSRSRPSLHRRSSSPVTSSSPGYLPIHNLSPGGPSDLDDVADEENLSPLDPRRFTPTLHASLVSEILSLRREVESKGKVIDALERSLHDSRTEIETLGVNLSRSNKEARSLKHQIQLLEGGTSSALTELAKERDEALESISDVRKKLEQAQKKFRTREEEVERTQSLWDRDKESWEGERRNLERKVHVVEGRLRIVLNEVAAAQAAGSLKREPRGGSGEPVREAAESRESDTASVHSSSQGRRRTSVTSVSTDGAEPPNARFSVVSVVNGPGPKYDGLNLAQELAFEEEDSDHLDDVFTPDSPEALPEERPPSVHSQFSYSMGMGMKARKILGLSFEGSVEGQLSPDRAHFVIPEPFSGVQAKYHDAAIQYSPPPSPTPPAEREESMEQPKRQASVSSSKPQSDDDEDHSPSATVAANPHKTDDSSSVTLNIDMVSTSCQTIGDLPSPPWTPKVIESPSQPAAVIDRVAMMTASTQTDQVPTVDEDKKATAVLPKDNTTFDMQIPMIAIHPPRSDPPSPRDSVVLPPQTKNVSCQTNFRSIVDSKSIAIQTEEIRIDQRPVKLPASLLPSAIPDLPSDVSVQNPPVQPYRAPPPRSHLREKKQLSSELPGQASKGKPKELKQACPGNNDNGPLAEDSKSGIRRPFRSSSLFAGFEQMSDEELPGAETDVFSDDELLNRPFASYTLRRGKLVSVRGRSSLDGSPLSEIDEHLLDNETEMRETSMSPEDNWRPGSKDKAVSSMGGHRAAMASSSKPPDIRRAAMISSGAAAHHRTRARSPSEPSIDSGSAGSSIAPPFPVPVRLSSRKIPLSGSDGRQSPTPSSSRNFSDRGRQSIVRRPTLRRVRSATAMSQPETNDPSESRSPPTSFYAPDSPRHPPMPFDDITAPRERGARRRLSSARAPSYRAFAHKRTDSAATSVQQTSVVDAIAQTMIGEWMFKYVRRRKSFGVGESKESWDGKTPDELSASITNSGVRHKRWVWLAPYERAVMWSSKQPTSGSALLGKSGRKLTIQSVLDVKDDNPLPKGASTQAPFNRSILILTPQRALKFTATSIERHFVWLTALSFLSHSGVGVHDLAALPPVPQQEFDSPAPTAALRRLPIRDSIRVAKGKPRPNPKSKRSFTGQPAPVPELPVDALGTIDSMEAADPPVVPRFSNHSRKRSNTTPRVPAIRSFASHATMPSSYSAGSAEGYVPGSTGGHGFNSGRSSFSRRTSEGSGRSSAAGTGNFFDAIGTVRMEAFIANTESNRHRAHRSRHARKASSQWSQGNRDLDFPTFEDSSEIYYRNDDPFRGF